MFDEVKIIKLNILDTEASIMRKKNVFHFLKEKSRTLVI